MPSYRATHTRTIYKRMPTADGRGVTSVPDGSEHADLLIEIDLGGIMKAMADSAMRNKSRKAKMIGGAVTVSVMRSSRNGVSKDES